MTGAQIKHVEEQLIQFIDNVLEKGKRATPAEIAALPEVALALAKIHEI